MATSSAAARSCPIPGGSIAIDKAVTDAAIKNRILATARIYLALDHNGIDYCPARSLEQGGDFVDPLRYRFGPRYGARSTS